MKRLLSILRLILRAKLIFKNPNNSKIVVFDDTSIKDFNNNGSPDIFVAGGIIPGSYPNHYPNKLHR